jgi:hypothetical protein
MSMQILKTLQQTKRQGNPYCPQLEPAKNWNWTTLEMTNVEQFFAFVKNLWIHIFFEILEIIEPYVLIIYYFQILKKPSILGFSKFSKN